MSYPAPICWLCEKRFYRGRFGLITRRRETTEGWKDLHVTCAQRFDEEGESAAREITRPERVAETRHA